MTRETGSAQSVWTATRWREHPLRMVGIVMHLVLRELYGLFWIAAFGSFAIVYGALLLRLPAAKRV